MDDIKVFQRFLNDIKDIKDFQQLEEQKVQRSCINKSETFKTKRRQTRFNPLEEMNEVEFRKKYRYTKENMRRIIEIVRDDLEVDYYDEPMKRNQVPIDLQILSAIRFFGGTEHPQLTALAHGVSLHTMAKITRRVASVLSSKASRYIRMPATLSEKERMMKSFQVLSNMPQVIGALVQTTVRLQLDSNRANQATRSCHSDSPVVNEELVHLQLVSDAEHKIRDLDIRLSEELDLHAAPELFALSRIKERFEQNEFRGRILLGSDSLYCSSCLFTPVQYPRNKSEELYNYAHKLTFAPAIKCLNLWMRRFGILGSEILGTFGSAKQTITALALLHNMAMDWNDPSIDAESNYSFYKPNFLGSVNGLPVSIVEEQRNRKEFIKAHFASN